MVDIFAASSNVRSRKRVAGQKIHAGHCLLAIAGRFDWWAHKMATEYQVDGGRADVIFISKSGYLTEIEIKISRSDWNADSSKAKWRKQRPHVARFYYVVPDTLACSIPEWVPGTAGVISVSLNEFGEPFSREVRSAKRMRAQKMTAQQLAAIDASMYYRFWRRELRALRDRLRAPAARGVAA